MLTYSCRAETSNSPYRRSVMAIKVAANRDKLTAYDQRYRVGGNGANQRADFKDEKTGQKDPFYVEELVKLSI